MVMQSARAAHAAERYIETNHHLPDIPSADEVQANGIGAGEMESKLPATVEQLTLHMIETERENTEIEASDR